MTDHRDILDRLQEIASGRASDWAWVPKLLMLDAIAEIVRLRRSQTILKEWREARAAAFGAIAGDTTWESGWKARFEALHKAEVNLIVAAERDAK